MTEQDSTHAETARLTVPKIHVSERCCDRGPGFICNRPAGHTGRHCFSWQHTDGRVRGVWGCQCDGLLKPGSYCTECGAVRQEGEV